jgi:hypothetical protein
MFEERSRWVNVLMLILVKKDGESFEGCFCWMGSDEMRGDY